MRSILKNKRGVSEIIASLIVILIVSIAGTTLYSYGMNIYNSSWSFSMLQINGRKESTQERLKIINVWRDSGNQLNLTILNHGKIEIAINAVYIDGKMMTINQGNGTIILIGDKTQLLVTPSFSIQDGRTYLLIAVSERGSKDEIYWKS